VQLSLLAILSRVEVGDHELHFPQIHARPGDQDDQRAGVKYFSIKDTHLPLKSSRAKRQEARKKVEDAGLILMGGE